MEDGMNDAMQNGDQRVEGSPWEAAITNSTEYKETMAKHKQWHNDTCWWKSLGRQHLSKIQMKF